MKALSPPNLYLALLHHPVKNKNGEDIRQTVIPDRLLLLLGMLEDYNEKEEDVNNENAES